jgi:hypothetical protein
MRKNAIWLERVSTDWQAKFWESLKVQHQESISYCKRNNINLIKTFTERYTWKASQRPIQQEIIEYIKYSTIKIDYLIITKIDRVSRWWVVKYDNFKKELEALWVTLIDIHWVIGEDKNVLHIEWVDTDKYNWAKSNAKVIAETVNVLMAEWEINNILQRTVWQAIRNNQKGFKVRASNYGFSNKTTLTENWKKTIQIEDENESIYIKEMYKLASKHTLSDREITNKLNAMGFQTRQTKKWNDEKNKIIWFSWEKPLNVKQLRRYIQNPIYAWVLNEQWTWNKPIKAPYKWLVDIELWNEANRWKYKIIEHDWNVEIEFYQWEKKLKTPTIKKRKNYNPDYPFSKVLQCPICWWHLTSEKSKSKSWKYHHYYSCRWKNGHKHKNYWLRRDEINSFIIEYFSKLKFDKQSLKYCDLIAEEIYKEREQEHIEKNKLIDKNITKLEDEKKVITENIHNIIAYPELLKAQNEKVEDIKQKIEQYRAEKVNNCEKLWLEKFKSYNRTILEHLDKLVLQRDKPTQTNLIFDVVFGWKIEFEKLQSRTPITQEFLALNTKKDFQKIWKSSLNVKWYGNSHNYHTLYEWVINLINKVDKRQYVIDAIEL